VPALLFPQCSLVATARAIAVPEEADALSRHAERASLGRIDVAPMPAPRGCGPALALSVKLTSW
jgi:hypothetical protein